MRGVPVSGIRDELILTTDAYLDRLAERFGELNIRGLLGLDFQFYIRAPEKYDRLAEHLLGGNGFRIDEDGLWPVALPESCHA